MWMPSHSASGATRSSLRPANGEGAHRGRSAVLWGGPRAERGGRGAPARGRRQSCSSRPGPPATPRRAKRSRPREALARAAEPVEGLRGERLGQAGSAARARARARPLPPPHPQRRTPRAQCSEGAPLGTAAAAEEAGRRGMWRGAKAGSGCAPGPPPFAPSIRAFVSGS